MDNKNANQKFRLPPQNLEAEMSVLGGIMIDKEAMIKIADKLSAEDFYKDAHAKIYETMLDLYEQRQPIDGLSLSNRLNEKKQLESIGGQSYIATLTTVTPTASHIVSYAEIVKKKAILRRLLDASSTIAELSFQEDKDAEDLVDEAEQKLFAISQKVFNRNFVPLKDILGEAFDRIDELHKERGKLRGLPSGFNDLDNLLAGLQRSDLIILAARPSVGKTSLALDIARNCAIRTKEPVGVFSLEMSKEQLVDRMLCAEAGVDLWKLRTGNLSQSDTDDDFPKIGHAMGVLSEAPIFIDDTAGANVVEIRTKARRLKMEHGLGLIIIDYLQLMQSHGRSENRVLEVAEITRSLKALARELNVPIIALSQLSRAVEQSKPAIPKLAHLRESGSIEQDADVVLFIYRKAADRNYQIEEVSPDQRYIGEVHIAKHRNGPTGVVRLFFNEQRASFENLEKNVEGGTYFGE